MTVLEQAGKPADSKYLTALIFGPSKTGKTTLAATAPKPLILDLEGGTRSVRDTDALVIPVTSWAVFEQAVRELMTQPHDFQTVVVDSVTYLQELAAAEAQLFEHVMDDKKDARQAYGKIGAMVRHKLIQLHNLPVHTIFTSQLREREQDDIEAGKYPLVPDVSPAINKVVMALPDLICRTTVSRTGAKEVGYKVVFGPETRSQVGNRDLDLPVEATGVTLTKIIERYQKESK